MHLFEANDHVGDPERYLYDKLLISPSTLRYCKVFSDLVNLFTSLDGYSICEIGGGYGGQCRIIDAGSPLNEYTW